jgi:hypothetical protein
MENTPTKKLSDEEMQSQRRWQLVKDMSVVALAAGASSLASSYALRGTTLTDGSKAMIQAGVHTLVGGAVALGANMPRVGVGIVAGGWSAGFAKAEQSIRTQMYLRQLAQPQSAPAANNAAAAPQVGAGTAPGAQAFAPQPQRAYA